MLRKQLEPYITQPHTHTHCATMLLYTMWLCVLTCYWNVSKTSVSTVGQLNRWVCMIHCMLSEAENTHMRTIYFMRAHSTWTRTREHEYRLTEALIHLHGYRRTCSKKSDKRTANIFLRRTIRWSVFDSTEMGYPNSAFSNSAPKTFGWHQYHLYAAKRHIFFHFFCQRRSNSCTKRSLFRFQLCAALCTNCRTQFCDIVRSHVS